MASHRAESPGAEARRRPSCGTVGPASSACLSGGSRWHKRVSTLFLMPRRERREFVRLRQSAMAAPDDVYVRSQQQQIVTIEIARVRIGNVEHLQGRADRGECTGECTGV